jgi:hypothetical protein
MLPLRANGPTTHTTLTHIVHERRIYMWRIILANYKLSPAIKQKVKALYNL